MKILKKIFAAEDSHKEVNAILARGKSLLEKNFYEWATVEFNKALVLNPKLAAETVTKLFQEMRTVLPSPPIKKTSFFLL